MSADALPGPLTELVGSELGNEQHVVVEAGPVRAFAEAVTASDPAYRSAAGPVPPTFPFAFSYWGTAGEGGAAGLPLERLRGPGRMLLHGEQAFRYHRWPSVGDHLIGTSTVTDVYEKAGGKATMHFYVTRTEWRDAGDGAPVVDAEFTLIVRISLPSG